MSNYSPDLLWQCVRNNSCFIKKGIRGCTTFSKEPNNLIGIHCLSTSGLFNPKPVGMTLHEKKSNCITVSIRQRKKDAIRKSKNSFKTFNLVKGKAGLPKLEKILGNYRPDLLPLARKKFDLLSKSK